MSNMEQIQSPESLESSDLRSTELQTLNDATFEPRSYVEQSGDYQQAESIQTTLTNIVSNIPNSMDYAKNIPLPIPNPEDGTVAQKEPPMRADLNNVSTGSGGDGRDDVTPITLPDVTDRTMAPQKIPQDAHQSVADRPMGKMGKDPLTGEEFGGQTGDSSEDSSPLVMDSDAGGLVSEETTLRPGFNGLESGDQVPPQHTEGLVHKDDVGKIQTGTSKTPGGPGAGPIGGIGDEQQMHDLDEPGRILPENMPFMGKVGIGMGPYGMLEKIVNQTKGGLPGGPPAGGSSSSGGGPPVSNPKGGKGHVDPQTDDVDRLLDAQDMQDDSPSDGKTTYDGDSYHMEGHHWEKDPPQESDPENPPEGDPIDGDFGTPYTGSGGGGTAPEPDIVGGPESGHFTPLVSIGGKTVGGGSKGSEDPDDSGKFIGDPNLTASGTRPNNPDDPDYYTPNELREALKAK